MVNDMQILEVKIKSVNKVPAMYRIRMTVNYTNDEHKLRTNQYFETQTDNYPTPQQLKKAIEDQIEQREKKLKQQEQDMLWKNTLEYELNNIL